MQAGGYFTPSHSLQPAPSLSRTTLSTGAKGKLDQCLPVLGPDGRWRQQSQHPARGSAPAPAHAPLKGAHARPVTFITPLGLVRPLTRTHVRLLGPCFKTGRMVHRSLCTPRETARLHGLARLCDRRRTARITGGFANPPTPPPPVYSPHPPLPVGKRKKEKRRRKKTQGYQSVRAFDVPSNGSRRPTTREYRRPTPAWVQARPSIRGSLLPTESADRQRDPHPAEVGRLNPSVRPSRFHPFGS